MLQDFFLRLSSLIHDIGNALLPLLPLSPFRDWIDGLQMPDYLGYLNWFFPVSGILKLLSLWLVAVAAFYLYSVLMRWVKILGD